MRLVFTATITWYAIRRTTVWIFSVINQKGSGRKVTLTSGPPVADGKVDMCREATLLIMTHTTTEQSEDVRKEDELRACRS